MNVRLANYSDIERLAELGAMFYNETILKNFVGYDADSIKYLIETYIDLSNAIAFVLEKDNVVIGGFLGIIVPLYWNNSVTVAQQIAWFVHPEHRGIASFTLLSAFEKWAKEQGAKVIFSGAKKNEGFESMDKMMRHKEYFELESAYIKEVATCQQSFH